MDSAAFDRLTTTFATRGTRRGLTRLLMGVPLLGGLGTLFGAAPDIAAADDDHGSSHRRRRRKTRHKHRRNTHRHKDKHKHKTTQKRRKPAACIPESAAQTCAGKCATVANNCGVQIDCGPCACSPACPLCQTCDASTGQCVNLADGTGCGAGLECVGGTCACTATSCGGCCADTSCVAVGSQSDAQCGTGTPGAACQSCSNPTPVCAGGTCTTCSPSTPCPSGQCCSGGQCVSSCPTCQTCSSGQCQAVANNSVDCMGSPILSFGCTDRTDGVGICVDGACSCSNMVYDPTTNRCLCNATSTALCAANPPGTSNCCIVGQVCTFGGVTGCVGCP